ncbi:MAG: four helix bundle protein [Gemmatimonadaceae bacterium]|nr:four helix bundle protein [Gemmatimonadaceae bacterium]
MSDCRNLRVLDATEDLAATVLSTVAAVDVFRAPGIRGQLVRAVTAISANIAEAANLGTDPNFKRQLRLSLASANEAGSHLRVLSRTGALGKPLIFRCEAKRIVVCKMLVSLLRAIEEREAHREAQQRERLRGGRNTKRE